MLTTIGAASQRIGDLTEAFAAPAFNLDLMFETKKSLYYLRIQNKRIRAVGSKNFWHRASGTETGIPRQRVRTALNQATGLHIAPTVKIGEIVFTVCTCRCFHLSY